MRALAFKTNGGPEVFEEIDRPIPEPGAGQVVIKVAYAGVNFAEIQHRRGEFGLPDGPDGYDVPGLEVAGTIAEVGAGAAGLVEGEQVAAYLPAFGGYAEYAVSDASLVRSIGGVEPAAAAGLPCVVPTAYGVLQDAGRLRPGETVLIHAATGGVGSAAARIARTRGAARVFGTVGSPDKTALAESLGYDVLFHRDDFAGQLLEATGGKGADLVLDPIGGPVRATSLSVLAPFGRVVAFGDLGRHEDWTADVWELWKTNKTVAGFNIGDLARRSPAAIGGYLAEALIAIESGELVLPSPRIRPLASASVVHQELESGAHHGKTVLSLN